MNTIALDRVSAQSWRRGMPHVSFGPEITASKFVGGLSRYVIALGLAFVCSAGAQEWPTIELSQPITGFTAPVHITHAGDGSGRLFIVELGGRIKVIAPDGTRSEFLNISNLVGCSQGLLSMAFPPGLAAKRHFYVNYTDFSNCDLVIARFSVAPDSTVADPATKQELLRIPKPAAYVGPAIFHSGGELAFGRDGYLYVGVGDGDTGHSPGDTQKLGQNLGSLRGKMLRLDVESPGTAGYTSPASNPFVDVAGARPEIWALGLRNPWRSSFDRETGDFYIADVGQDKFEEINFQPANAPGGANYGWRFMEGVEKYLPDPGTKLGELTLPIHTYMVNRMGDCSITGGRVYRGDGSPRMQGVYFYGDFSSGRIWGLRKVGSGWENRLLRDAPPPTGPVFTSDSLVTFGEDEPGNIYVSDYRAGTIYMLSDTVTIENNAPVARPDTASTRKNTAVVIPVLDNDSDADGDVLTLTQVSAPLRGTTVIQGAAVKYTPAKNFSGDVSFNYTVIDGRGGAATAVVTVAIRAK